MAVVQTRAQVVSNEEVIHNHFVLECISPEIAAAARPGHFVNVYATEQYSSILRKPFSIYQADAASGKIAMLYQLRGATTIGMARKLPGEWIDLVGPLGGRVFEPDLRPTVTHVMVGGGYGVPPLVFLSKEIKAGNPSSDVRFIVGARSQDLLLCEAEVGMLGVAVLPTTEDGSHGTRGRVTDVLSGLLGLQIAVYCCGPTGMMRAVGDLCVSANIPCQLSLEMPMPCGIGVCMGCVADLADGRRVRTCLDGPVFQAQEVAWT